MIKVVVDTNTVFSAILNTEGKIGYLLLNSKDYFTFFSPNLLRIEIEKYRQKLLDISKLTPEQLEESIFQIFNTITFVLEEQIPFEIWQKVLPIVRDADMDDIAFVAMSEFLDIPLWTGDKKLIEGTQAKGFMKCITTEEILEWRQELEKKKK